MARYEDSAAGWLIYQQHGGSIALDELNQILLSRGFRPVAQRSLSHYRKLERLGYESYISMNRLDIRHASDSVFDITDRSRYEEVDAEIPATLHLPTAQRFEVLEISGLVTKMSEGFAVLLVDDPSDEVLRATRSTKYDRGVLKLTTSGFERAVQVRSAVEIDNTAEILLTFRSLLSTDILFPERVGQLSRSRLTIYLSDDPTMHSVVLAVHRSFDLLESTRGMIETVLTELPEDERPVLPSPRVTKLRTGSPMIQDLIGDPIVWILVGFVIKWVLNRMKDLTQIEGNLQQIQTTQDENERAAERHRYEIRSMQLANMKDELEVHSLLRSAEDELAEKYGVDINQISLSKMDRLEALKDQAIEAAAELASESSQIDLEHVDDDDLDDNADGD